MIFHSYGTVYQRVPSSNQIRQWDNILYKWSFSSLGKSSNYMGDFPFTFDETGGCPYSIITCFNVQKTTGWWWKTILKNIGQWQGLHPIYEMENKNIWNHQPDYHEIFSIYTIFRQTHTIIQPWELSSKTKYDRTWRNGRVQIAWCHGTLKKGILP